MTPAPFRPTLPRTAARFALAALGSLLVHALFISGAMRGLADVFNWSRNAEPAPLTVRARIVELTPPAPASTPAAPLVRPKPRPRKPAQAAPAPVVPQLDPVPVARAEAVAAPEIPAQPDPAPAPEPAAHAPAPEPAAPAPPPEPPPAPPLRPVRNSPLPPRATIALELTLESNNYKVWATQQWSQGEGRYRVTLNAEARALFFTLGSIMLDSQGVITADGLRPERYVDERNKRRTTVEFGANEKTAQIEEANGNRKSVGLAGQAADIMSLTYDLAFNPDINVGAPFTLSNRDSIEEIRLVARRDEMLSSEAGNLATRFYDFRRPDGSGGIQVWLAVEKQWLPAKIRILGRDGALTMVATRYDLNPVDSR